MPAKLSLLKTDAPARTPHAATENELMEAVEPGSGYRVLVLCRLPFLRELYARALLRAGFEVYTDPRAARHPLAAVIGDVPPGDDGAQFPVLVSTEELRGCDVVDAVLEALWEAGPTA